MDMRLAVLAEETRVFLAAAKAASTRRAYGVDWDDFRAWCRRHALSSLPATPETVALYITDLAASRKPATLRRRLTVISRAHQTAGYPSPASMQAPLRERNTEGHSPHIRDRIASGRSRAAAGHDSGAAGESARRAG